MLSTTIDYDRLRQSAIMSQPTNSIIEPRSGYFSICCSYFSNIRNIKEICLLKCMKSEEGKDDQANQKLYNNDGRARKRLASRINER